MARINEHFLKLEAGYLFPEISRRIEAFTAEHPEAALIRLGIGDVTEPLPAGVCEAMRRAVEDLGDRERFHGYGPEQGYAWLREAIAEHEYAARGCAIGPEEVFVSDGSKCDTANILDIFAGGPDGVRVAVTDPVYPVYVDTNVMAGNTGPARAGRYEGLCYLPATAENGFLPPLPEAPVDLVYLCYPNNPTGAVADRAALERWVDYARREGVVILYDAAYEAYISDPGLPRSIYEIAGAEEVAIEFRSFSKKAGFTGVRCAWTVVPSALEGRAADGSRHALRPLWNRRHATKFNGASYLSQRGAEAVYTPQGKAEVQALVDFYLENARIVRQTLTALGLEVYGGVHAPYVWVKTPGGTTSWAFFDTLLHEAHVVGTPGAGFGTAGEGYFRLSAFNSRANIEAAMERMKQGL